MTFFVTLPGMDEDQRRRVGEYVRAQRMHKFKTVDKARIAADISRGAWDSVEQGKPVRDFTYGAVEAALEMPPGYLEALARGNTDLMEALVDTDGIFKDLMEWARTLKPGIAPEYAPPTSALTFWSTEQMLEMLAEREQGHRETIAWHVRRYQRLLARLDDLSAKGEAPELSDRDRAELERYRQRLQQEAVRRRHKAPDETPPAEDVDTEAGR